MAGPVWVLKSGGQDRLYRQYRGAERRGSVLFYGDRRTDFQHMGAEHQVIPFSK